MESLIDGTLYLYLGFQQVVEHVFGDLTGQTVVDDVGCIVEDITEHAVVQLLLVVGNVGFLESGNITVVELQRTAHILTDGCGRELAETCLQNLNDMLVLLDRLRRPALSLLACLQGVLRDVLSAFY